MRAGETATIDLTLHNYRLPPQQLSLSVPQAASGWKATILGGGQPVSAAMVGPDGNEKLQLRLEPPTGAGPGNYHFLVAARGDSGELRLPITLTIGQELPAKLKLSTNFPALRGTATTAFKFTVTVANDSGRDATINFTADAPKNFQVTFTEAYGSQQITSIPIGAGKSKDIDASVALPRDTAAGDYKLVMHAKSDAASADLPLGITIFGQPRLSLSGEGGRLSGEAYAGKASPLTVVVRNDGTEAARDIELGATAPDGWKTSFDPKDVAILAAGKSQSVQVTFTPSDARDRRRLPGDDPRQRRGWPVPIGRFSHHRLDLDPLGHGRHRGHRHRPSGGRLCRRPLRPPLGGRDGARRVVSRRRADQALRRGARRRSYRPRGRRRRDRRHPRPQRLRQDDDDSDAAGADRANQGRAEVAGFDPLREPLEVKRRVGYLPDTVGFYDGLSARDNLAYTGRLAGLPRREIDDRFERAMIRVGLPDAGRERVATFSRGMRQRLGLAEVLMKEPQIAILDEPTATLDPHSTNEFLAMVRGLKADGTTVLLSSHHLDQVQSVCDRVALFNRGRIALAGSVTELAQQVLGGGMSSMSRLAGPGWPTVSRHMAEVVRVQVLGPELYRVDCDARPARRDCPRTGIDLGADRLALCRAQSR